MIGISAFAGGVVIGFMIACIICDKCDAGEKEKRMLAERDAMAEQIAKAHKEEVAKLIEEK
jgi:hypothetical protein